jgi:hypothetical protein
VPTVASRDDCGKKWRNAEKSAAVVAVLSPKARAVNCHHEAGGLRASSKDVLHRAHTAKRDKKSRRQKWMMLMIRRCGY